LIAEPLDEKWLKRVFNSTSAEPLHQPFYQQRPLMEESRALLLQHRQFASATP
jgi:hypothetical protein